MPVDLRHDHEKGLLYATVTNPFTPDDLNAALAEITNSKQYAAHAPTLWDMRAVEFAHFNRDLELEFIEVRRRFPNRDKARVALIVATDLAFGMLRMYETLSELNDLPQTMRILHDYTEGENWLLRKD
jgi:hypothetical protein